MDIKTLESTVFTIMAEQLGLSISELSPDFDIIARGYADSLDLIELVMVFDLSYDTDATMAEAYRAELEQMRSKYAKLVTGLRSLLASVDDC